MIKEIKIKLKKAAKEADLIPGTLFVPKWEDESNSTIVKIELKLKYVGTIGDYLKHPKTRKMVKDVLGISVYALVGPSLWAGRWAPKELQLKESEFINAVLLDVSWPFRVSTLLHEAIHAQRSKLGRNFGHYPQLYHGRIEEKSARRAEEFFIKLDKLERLKRRKQYVPGVHVKTSSRKFAVRSLFTHFLR